MGRESVPQLTSIRSQIYADLLEIVAHCPARPFVAAELRAHQPLSLSHAACDGPHQQVRDVDGHRLRECRELGCVVPDLCGVAVGI